jgi:beta-lactamase regulating signal transducer with metallopeptidase domain
MASVAAGRMAWLAWGWLLAWRVRWKGSPAEKDRVIPALSQCAEALGVGKVEIVVTPALQSPATMGVFRKFIFLPESLAQQPEDVSIAVLGHELAHVRRNDYGWNLVWEALLAPLAWHPVAWLLQRRIESTREMACDDLVAERLLEPRRYARSLVAVAASACAAPALGVHDGGDLRERVRRLVDDSLRAPWRARRWQLSSGVTLVVLAGVVDPWRETGDVQIRLGDAAGDAQAYVLRPLNATSAVLSIPVRANSVFPRSVVLTKQ